METERVVGMIRRVFNATITVSLYRSGCRWPWVAGLMLLFVLNGCSSFQKVSIVSPGEEPSEPPSASELTLESPQSSPAPIASAIPRPSAPPPSPPPVATGEEIVGDILAQPAEEVSSLPWVLEDVFFDYDQYVIRTEAMDALSQNAKVLLKRYPGREVIIQGHCDERGTEEYNFILGKRRASVVKSFLKDLGVPAASMRVLSFGKTKPFCLARTAACFQQNRRAHFVLK